VAVEEGQAALLLEQGVIILGAALVFVTLYRRFGIGAVLGYLTAGMLLGPHLLGVVAEPEAMIAVGDIGIALLLFLVGMELNPSRLWRLRGDIFGLGLAQVVACGAVLTLLVGLARESSLAAAIAIGMPLALSSTAQVLPFLRGTGEISTRTGERAFSVLLFQDLAVVPMLIILAALSRAPGAESRPGWLLVLSALGGIAGLVLAGRYLLNPLLRVIGRVSERELFVVAGLFTVLAAAAVMHALGLSMALGAFVAGVMLADSPYRHELEADVDPFRSILLGLFFVAVGMNLDLAVIAERPLVILALALALVAVKAGVIYAIARASGVRDGEALRLGLLLSQGGEFAFVLFAAGSAAAIIGATAVSTYSAVVTLSMVTTPFLMMVYERLARLRRGKGDTSRLSGPDAAPSGRAIVIGYGRFGQTVAQMLMAKDIDVVLIDSKPSQIEVSGDFGVQVYYGDGTRIDLLRRAGAEEAQLLLFCIDGVMLDAHRLEPILEAFPQAQVLVRTFDRRHVMRMDGVEVSGIYREVFESAVSMGRDALLALGVAAPEARRVERAYRERDAERLAEQSKSGDIATLKERIFRPGGEGLDEYEGVFDSDKPADPASAKSR
jgi:glutathione-regulated potassium-efflux system protein KefB